MFDEKPVHLAMQRIFTPLGANDAPAPAVERSRSVQAPGKRRRWFMGKDGIAAVGFALAITGVGLVAAPLLTSPPTPPRVSAPTASVAPIRPVMPAPTAPAMMPAPAVVTPPPAAVASIPAVTAPARITTDRQVRRPAYRARKFRRHYRARREAPRFHGAALRRALARDVILTRRLNQQALRRMRAR